MIYLQFNAALCKPKLFRLDEWSNGRSPSGSLMDLSNPPTSGAYGFCTHRNFSMESFYWTIMWQLAIMIIWWLNKTCNSSKMMRQFAVFCYRLLLLLLLLLTMPSLEYLLWVLILFAAITLKGKFCPKERKNEEKKKKSTAVGIHWILFTYEHIMIYYHSLGFLYTHLKEYNNNMP